MSSECMSVFTEQQPRGWEVCKGAAGPCVYGSLDARRVVGSPCLQSYLRDHALLLRVEMEVMLQETLAVPDAVQWPSGTPQNTPGPEPGTYVLRGSYSPALFYAAASNRPATIERLIAEGGADANAPDPDGYTPLLVACESGAAAAAAALLKGGARAGVTGPTGGTPLYAAFLSMVDSSGAPDPPADLVELMAAVRHLVIVVIAVCGPSLYWRSRGGHNRGARDSASASSIACP